MNGIESLGRYEEQPLVPEGGIQQIRKAADMLADFGRNGDTYIIHAAKGETVLPLEVLESNPRLKKMLFKQIEEMGLDPERYIVGNELNSINPVTGKPEFFFGKIFRAIKRVFKKVAPIVLPIAAPFLLPATLPIAFSAGLGSLAGGLIAGQSPVNAFKGALISGGLAGLGNVAFGGTRGFGSGSFFGSRANPTQSFGDIFKFRPTGGTPGPTAPSTLIQKGAEDAAKRGVSNTATGFVGGGDAIPSSAEGFGVGADLAINTPRQSIASQAINPLNPELNFRTGTMGEKINLAVDAQLPPPELPLSTSQLTESRQILAGSEPPVDFGTGTPRVIDTASTSDTGILDALKSGVDRGKSFIGETYDTYLSPSRASIQPSAADINTAYQNKLAEYASAGITLGPAEQKALFDSTQQSLQPGFLSKYGPLGAVGVGGIMALDAISQPEEGQAMTLAELQSQAGPTGTDLYAEDPTRYGFGTQFYGRNPYYQQQMFLPPAVRAKQGGEIVGPGTATSDSVPALLSDGEFVMTAGAVRGAGSGNRAEGARKMYEMMKQFEQRVSA